MIQYRLYIVGKRNCAFDSCNALEFRSSEYCLKHNKDEEQTEAIPMEIMPQSSTLLIKNPIDDKTHSVGGFIIGFWFTPIFLVIISLLVGDVCSVWLFLGILIPPISYLIGRNKFSIGFALGSLIGVLIFIIPWFSFTLSNDLICYDVVWASNCGSPVSIIEFMRL